MHTKTETNGPLGLPPTCPHGYRASFGSGLVPTSTKIPYNSTISVIVHGEWFSSEAVQGTSRHHLHPRHNNGPSFLFVNLNAQFCPSTPRQMQSRLAFSTSFYILHLHHKFVPSYVHLQVLKNGTPGVPHSPPSRG